MTEKNLYRDPLDFHVSVERRSEVVVPILVRAGSRDDARVHECGQAKVYEDKYGDYSLAHGNSVPGLFQDVPLDTPAIRYKCLTVHRWI